ncbi:zinc-ribbon domain-containing protein [Desulfovibrio sp. OttesenSCG-928-G15]|nr:zinc-ribbon domain-containing protein [Desulfovibrio sp. OttesenSCG-928-G15]
MEITCPRCETVFAMPDELYAPGKKARCTQCGMIFPMQQGLAQAAPADEAAVAKGKKPLSPRVKLIRNIAVSVLFAAALLAGGWWAYTSFLSPVDSPNESTQQAEPVAENTDGQGGTGEQVEGSGPGPSPITDVTISELRQSLVDNIHMGRLVVLQGYVVNSSTVNKSNIVVDAWLTDKDGKVLSHQKQLCGVTLDLYQLQSLNEKHLTEALNNKVQLLSSNANVPPGGKVPFTVIFDSLPETLHRFHLRVADAQNVSQE